MICQFCNYEFPDECGRYGCPNCLSEGLDGHCSHVYDESDTCFECGQPRPQGHTDAFPAWLQELADTCPEEDIANLNNTLDKL